MATQGRTRMASISLLARRLEFIHPVKKEKLVITAPFPDGDIWDLFKDAEVYKKMSPDTGLISTIEHEHLIGMNYF